jgi:hypothetical protein
MKSITLVAWNRSVYTKKVLKSLEKCNTKGYSLFVGLEPGCPEVFRVIKEFADKKVLPVKIIQNKKRLGVDYNNYNVYNIAFSEGSEFNVALEDDSVLSPDALDLANWFFRYKKRDNYLLLNLFNNSTNKKSPLILKETSGFCPWGYCITKKMFEKWLKQNWMRHKLDLNLIFYKLGWYRLCNQIGYDWFISAVMKKNNLKSLTPVLSRTRNIGREKGTHCTPELYDQQFSKDFTLGEKNYGKKFKVRH